jgi:hypothetical protein
VVMKLYSKLILGVVGLTSISRCLLAADATGSYTTYTTNTYAPLNYSAPDSIASSSSNAVILALSGQALLLKEMMQEHRRRAADLTEKSQSEKAKWETDLVNELQEKNVRLQKSIDQTTQASAMTTGLKAAAGDVDDQLLFVTTVEARQEQIRLEVAAALEDGRVLTMRLGTNKAPENFAGMSLALSENDKFVKELQREQLELELRRLEFRAISKMLQK